MYKLAIVAAILATANAGLIGAPAVAYSAAPAVSSAYLHQASPVAVAHAAPVISSYAHAAPVVSSYAHAAPVVSSYAHAAPVISSYAHAAPVAVHAPAIGASHQSVVRSLGGNAAVSTYSKAVDSAFSSVRKFDTRITNDALYAHAAPVVSSYAAPIAHAAPIVSSYAHAAPVVSGYAHAAPVAAYAAHAAPVAAYAAHAPVITKTAAVAYSPAAVVSHASFSGLGASYAW